MFKAIYFSIGVAIGSFGLANLNAMATDKPVITAKAPTVLGHRIGPNGAEMLVMSK